MKSRVTIKDIAQKTGFSGQARISSEFEYCGFTVQHGTGRAVGVT